MNSEPWIFVTCEELRKEYIRQLLKIDFAGGHLIRLYLDRYERKEKHYPGFPTNQPKLNIKNRKDQKHVNCAEGNDVRVILTNDLDDFQPINENSPEVPQIINWNNFKNDTTRDLLFRDHSKGYI